jgi:hypothetical protein
MPDEKPRSKAEEKFIDQYARKLTVEWAKQTLGFGAINEPTKADLRNPLLMECMAHAERKKWVSKSKPRKLISAGFSTAAAFLKR